MFVWRNVGSARTVTLPSQKGEPAARRVTLLAKPTKEVVGEVNKILSKFILCDHVRNSHDHSVLQSIDITRRNLMLITLGA